MNEVAYETFSPGPVETNDFAEPDSERAGHQEQVFTRLDSEVTPLVSANAHVIVRCWWMDGAQVTLSEAMNGYYTIMTEDNVDMVIADVLALLADPVLEKLEPEVLEPEPEAQKLARDGHEDPEEAAKAQPIIAKSLTSQKHAAETAGVKPYMGQTRPALPQAELQAARPETTIQVVEELPTAQVELGEAKSMGLPHVVAEAKEPLPPVTFEPVKNEYDPKLIVESMILTQPAAKRVVEASGVEVVPVEEILQADAILPVVHEDEAVIIEHSGPQPLFDVLTREPAEAQALYNASAEGSDQPEASDPGFDLDALLEGTDDSETCVEVVEHFDSAEPEIPAESKESIEQVIKLAELVSEAAVPEVRLEIIAELEALLAEFSDEQLRFSTPLLFAQAVLKQANYFNYDDQTLPGSPTHEFINEPLLGLSNSKSLAAYSVLGRPATRAYLLNFS